MGADEDSLWKSYALDADEALHEIEDTLLSLEAAPDDTASLHRLYRALHTLKGNSAVLGLSQIEGLAHAVEDLVGKVRDEGMRFDAALVELTLSLTDGLASAVRQAVSQHTDAAQDVVAPQLERARQWLREHGGSDPAAPAVERGQLMIWSTPAEAPPPSAALDRMSLELFLAVARRVLIELPPWLEKLRAGDHAAHPPLLALSEELQAPAQRLGLSDVESAAANLHDAALLQRSPEVFQCIMALGQRLVECEARYRAEAQAHAQEFEIATLAARLSAPSVRASARPSRRVVSRSLRPGPHRSLRAPTLQRTVARGRDEAAAKSDSLRVDARKLSQLLDLAGEIALTAGAVTHHPDLEGRQLEGFSAAAHELEMLIRELQNEVAVLRMVPVAGVFQNMRRVVRDTAKRTGKRAELVLVGEETEIDKVMADALHDPLVHLLRNAVDHGLEMPAQREAAGKPATGKIVLEAAQADGDIRVRVRDDGGGIVRARVRERAVERRLCARDAVLSDRETLELLFQPGFSTKDKIDEVSGRGVGLDVVKTGIESLRGRVQIDSEEGSGTCFTLIVPLTLAFMEAMVVRTQDRLFALPIEKVYEVFRPVQRDVARNGADGELMIRVRDQMVPVLWLQHFYDTKHSANDNSEVSNIAERVIVAVQTSRGVLALPVDELLGNQPIMLKPLNGLLTGVRAASGCGMLRNGDVALALDCERLHAV